MMVISFFTSRIMLNALGVDNYGINNVVGGLVSMFQIVSLSLTSTTSRFLTFGLGRGDIRELKVIFSTGLNIQIIISIIVVILIETIGVWFLNHRMNIPPNRMYAANWVLQCSVVIFVVGLISTPYNASLIAHEKMSVFAWMTIFSVAVKLIVVTAICFYSGDRLILMSILLLISSIMSAGIYLIYCKKHFEECTYEFIISKRYFKDMFSFAGWNFIGCTAGILKDSGVNVVINLFSGPAVNAARGIAMQLNSIISQFTNNFLTAVSPQITKDYATDRLPQMHRLIFLGTRFSFYLFLFLSLPVLLETEKILFIWLGEVPKQTVLFARLAIILSLSDLLSSLLVTAQLATGKIKNYQIVVGGILMFNLPVSYLLLYLGYIPEITLVVAIIISQISLVARIWFLRKMIMMSARDFFVKVYLNILEVLAFSIILPLIIFLNMSPGWDRFLSVCAISALWTGVIILFVGCSGSERTLIHSYVRDYIIKILKRQSSPSTRD